LVNQVNSVVAVAHGANVRILFEGFYHFAQLGGCPPVVAIQESDDLALSLRDSGVKCRRLAAVGFPNQAQAWLELPYDLGSPIGRAVVHDQDLHLAGGKVLLQYTKYPALDKALVVVRINQD